MNKAVRAAVVERSQGLCEACYQWGGESLHCDHFAGRRKGESVAKCWMLCPSCDHLKTANNPSAQKWVERWLAHCFVYGLAEEIKLAETRLAWIRAKGKP